jgi:hypothetical protein
MITFLFWCWVIWCLCSAAHDEFRKAKIRRHMRESLAVGAGIARKK